MLTVNESEPTVTLTAVCTHSCRSMAMRVYSSTKFLKIFSTHACSMCPPSARVHHHVDAERRTLMETCWSQGVGGHVDVDAGVAVVAMVAVVVAPAA